MKRAWLILRLRGIQTFVAAAVIGVLVAPWATQTPEVLIDTFDPRIMTVDPRGFLDRPGQVGVTPKQLVISASPRSQPTVHVLTSEVPFSITFSAAVLKRDSEKVFPLQMKLWNPRFEEAAEVWYSPDGTIMAGVRANQHYVRTQRLAVYTIGELRDWSIIRTDERLIFSVSSRSDKATFQLDREDLPRLFQRGPLSFTVYASAPSTGSSTAVLLQPIMSVPRQTLYATRVGSPLFWPVVSLVSFLSLLCLVTAVPVARIRWPRVPARDLVIFMLLAVISLVAGWFLSRLPGQPYDVRNSEVWSHIGRQYGLASIPTLSLLATEGGAHGGQPIAAMTYPYPPLLMYLFWFVGKVAPYGGVEKALKMLAMVGVVAGGGVLFVLLRRLRVGLAAAALATGAYALNPAILFDTAVWGQTDSFVALFLLIAAFGLSLESSSLLWTGTILAALTKQTGGVVGLVLIALGVMKFGARRMIVGLVPAMLIVFLFLTPALLSGIHPSSTYRPIVTKVRAFGTVGGMEAVNAIVSQGTFSPWSMLAGFEGAHGLERMAFPDFLPSRFGPSYFVLSRLTFTLILGFLAFVTVRTKERSPGFLLIVTAAYTVGAFLLLTRVLPRYLYFGVVFTAASLPFMPKVLGGVALAVLSGTMLVAMWGMLVFTSVWYPDLLPVFEPDRAWFNSTMAFAVNSDIGISLGGLLSVGVLLALLVAFLRGARNPKAGGR